MLRGAQDGPGPSDCRADRRSLFYAGRRRPLNEVVEATIVIRLLQLYPLRVRNAAFTPLQRPNSNYARIRQRPSDTKCRAGTFYIPRRRFSAGSFRSSCVSTPAETEVIQLATARTKADFLEVSHGVLDARGVRLAVRRTMRRIAEMTLPTRRQRSRPRALRQPVGSSPRLLKNASMKSAPEYALVSIRMKNSLAALTLHSCSEAA